MKLGDVLKKERERRKIALEDMAGQLGLSPEAYGETEAGDSPAERWGPLLALIAIKFEKPTSRFIARSGKSADAQDGQCGKLIRQRREELEKTPEETAEALEISLEEYGQIEAGKSPIEKWGPILLHFAEVVDLPVFNLFYPCALPLDKLEDYP